MKKERKEVIVDNCILQPFERIPETLNMWSIYKPKIHSELEINLSTLLNLSDTWSFKSHFRHFPKLRNLLRDVKPKWTQHTTMRSPGTFSRSNTAPCVLRLHPMAMLRKIGCLSSDAWIHSIESFGEFLYFFTHKSKRITAESQTSG